MREGSCSRHLPMLPQGRVKDPALGLAGGMLGSRHAVSLESAHFTRNKNRLEQLPWLSCGSANRGEPATRCLVFGFFPLARKLLFEGKKNLYLLF